MLQVRAIQVDAKGDLKTVVVATPDMTADYAVVVTLAERKGVKTVYGQPTDRVRGRRQTREVREAGDA